MKSFYPKTYFCAFIFTLIQMLACAQKNEERTSLKLWYDAPATDWMTQALPMGNGYLGVMFFGDPAEERLQFSEGSLWSGGKNANPEYNFGLKKDAHKNLPKVRELLAAGKLDEAHKLANAELTGAIHEKKENVPASDFGAQQPMGDLFVSVSHKGEIKKYKRELDISNATGKVSYEAGKDKFERIFFGNYTSRVMVYKFTSTSPETYSVRFVSPHKKEYEKFDKNQYTFGGSLKDNHQEFETAYHINTDGKISYTNGTLTVSNAKNITLIHTAATDLSHAKRQVSDRRVFPYIRFRRLSARTT